MKLLTRRTQTLHWLKPEGHEAWNSTLMPTNPRIVQELIMPCSLNTIKLLTTPLQVDTPVPRALAHCGPLPTRQKHTALFTSPKTLSPRFYVWHQWTEAEFWQQSQTTIFVFPALKIAKILLFFKVPSSLCSFTNKRPQKGNFVTSI